MDAYCAEVRKLEKNFQGLKIHHVLRDSNVAADVLAKLGSDRAKVPPSIFVEELIAPSIKQLGNTEKEKETIDPMEIDQAEELDQSRQIMVIQSDWRQTYIDFIKEKKLPEDKAFYQREETTRRQSRSNSSCTKKQKLCSSGG